MAAQLEFDAEKYKTASRHQKEWGNKIIAELSLVGDEVILDLGCGDGVLTECLAQRVPNGRVLGIDASSAMIGTASKLKRDNLTFAQMDIDDIDFDGEFDLGFSNATLQWVKDHKRLLQNVYRGLKLNGVVRFNFAGDGNCSTFFEVIRQAMADEPYRKYFADFDWPWYIPTIDEYAALVGESCFRDVRVWPENADRYFASADEMTKWLDQPCLVPFLKCIGAPDKQRFRDQVIEEMIIRTAQPDGRCFETFRRINVLAQKQQ